ncbi:hypothetical protein HDG33_003617 [Paraburkholderia sp. Cpub6]|nr:hypothetical protein [Paraburkholderia sp. Cpub6]
MQRAHHRNQRTILAENPDFIATCGAREIAVTFENAWFDQAHIRLTAAEKDDFRTARASVVEPFDIEAPAHFENQIRQFGQLTRGDERHAICKCFGFWRQTRLIAAVQKHNICHKRQLPQQLHKVKDVLP